MFKLLLVNPSSKGKSTGLGAYKSSSSAPLALAYIADPNTMGWAMEEVQRLAVESGRLDVQSHGYSGQLYITPETTREQIQAEIWPWIIPMWILSV